MVSSVAILARTNEALRIYEEALGAANVPYYLVGKSGYWGSAEIKATLSYLQAVIYPSDYSISGMLRAPFHPTRFLPKSKLATALKAAKTEDNSYWKILTLEPASVVDPRNRGALGEFTMFVHSLSRFKDLPAGEAIKKTLEALKAYDTYAEEESTPDNDPVLNLQTLVKIAGRHDTLKSFLDYARKVSAASKTKKGVALGTIHSVKGLEFNRVFMVQCSQGIIPHAKSTDLDGEKNCFFVGASRAEQELTVCYSGAPSQFIKHLIKKEEA